MPPVFKLDRYGIIFVSESGGFQFYGEDVVGQVEKEVKGFA